MVEAYVLIQAEAGRSAEVARAVGKIPGVRFADEVIGPTTSSSGPTLRTSTSSASSSSPRSRPSRESTEP
jgi:hypothetical protein